MAKECIVRAAYYLAPLMTVLTLEVTLGATANNSEPLKLDARAVAPSKGETCPPIELKITNKTDHEIKTFGFDADPASSSLQIKAPRSWVAAPKPSPDSNVMAQGIMDVNLGPGSSAICFVHLSDYFHTIPPGPAELTLRMQVWSKTPGKGEYITLTANVHMVVPEAPATQKSREVLMNGVSAAAATEASPGKLVREYVDQIRKGNFDEPMSIIERADTEDVRKATAFLKDSSSDVRVRMLHFLLEVGRAPKQSVEAKTLAHDGVIAAATQSDDPALADSAARGAQDPRLSWELTSDQADQVINTVKKAPSPELIMLVGRAHGAHVQDRLQELAKPAFGNDAKACLGQSSWSAVLALARGGDPPSLALVLKVTKALSAERDPTFRYVIPAKYLGYVGQPETVQLLLEQLFSDTKWFTGERNMKDSAAAYAVDPLLAALDRVPDEIVKLDPDLDREKRITKLRAWARKQGEFTLRTSKKTFTWHRE